MFVFRRSISLVFPRILDISDEKCDFYFVFHVVRLKPDSSLVSMLTTVLIVLSLSKLFGSTHGKLPTRG